MASLQGPSSHGKGGKRAEGDQGDAPQSRQTLPLGLHSSSAARGGTSRKRGLRGGVRRESPFRANRPRVGLVSKHREALPALCPAGRGRVFRSERQPQETLSFDAHIESATP